MHELSLLSNLMRRLDTIAENQNAQRIAKVRVCLGALSHISAEHFRDHFHAAALGSLAEGAKLDIREMSDTQDPNAQDIILESVDVIV